MKTVVNKGFATVFLLFGNEVPTFNRCTMQTLISLQKAKGWQIKKKGKRL